MRGVRLGCLALGLVLLGGSSCLLEPFDDETVLELRVTLPESVPTATGEPLRDPTGKLDLDAAGYHLRVRVSSPDLDEPIVAEMVPGTGRVSDGVLSFEMPVAAAGDTSIAGLVYLRTGEPGTTRVDGGAQLLASSEPLVRDLVGGERVELEFEVEPWETGSVGGEVFRPVGVNRPDVTHVALIDEETGTLLPRVEVHPVDTPAGRYFPFSIASGVPIQRWFVVRLYLLDGTIHDLEKTEEDDPRIWIDWAGEPYTYQVTMEPPI